MEEHNWPENGLGRKLVDSRRKENAYTLISLSAFNPSPPTVAQMFFQWAAKIELVNDFGFQAT